MTDSLGENSHYRREIEAIALVESCFPEKFGVPRQAGIAPSARGIIRLLPPYNHPNYIEGIEHYSHLWLTFGFHQNQWNGRAKVRPQRLGGNERMGVFATRSSFRPNGLGLSAVKLEAVDLQAMTLAVSGLDIIDGTPIYCIKPYIPFADAITTATSTFATESPSRWPLLWGREAEKMAQQISLQHSDFSALVEEVIGQNPIPQFHQDYERIYGVSLAQWNIRFRHCALADLATLEGLIARPLLDEFQRQIRTMKHRESPASVIVILEITPRESNI